MLGYASGQPAANQVYAFHPIAQPTVGQTLQFYDVATLASHGTATVTAVTTATQNYEGFSAQLTAAGVAVLTSQPYIYTLDRAVNVWSARPLWLSGNQI